MLVAQSCPTLCSPMDYSPPGPSVLGILQSRTLGCVAIPFSGDLRDTGIEPRSPALQVDSLPAVPPGKPDFSIDHLVMSMCRILSCCWKRVFAMSSVFSWQNSVSLCLASFCTPKLNLLFTPGIFWLPTFAFQSRTSVFLVFVCVCVCVCVCWF